MKPVRTWILIADGEHARILLNEGPGKGVRQIKGTDIGIPHPEAAPDHTDRPGRVYESCGATRHAIEASDSPVERGKRAFARKVALNLEANADNFDRLVVVAAPETLGTLRAEISAAVEAKVHATVPKDLTAIPTGKIADILSDTIAL